MSSCCDAAPGGERADGGARDRERRVVAIDREDVVAIPGSEAIAPRLAAGWPGERMTAAAVTKRLHTAIWTLRKTLGLEGVLRMS